MPRPERPLDTDDSPLARFAAGLRRLRKNAGNPGYRELAGRAHYGPSTLSEAAAGRKLPTLAVTLAYVEACGGDRTEWEATWRAVAADLAEPAPGADGHPPYAGLAALREDDAELFFGRDRVLEQLVNAVQAHRLAVVLGASGSGKSSLLRAGLVHKLRGDDWLAVVCTPGSHPLRELAVQLADPLGALSSSLHAELERDPDSLPLLARQALAGQPESSELLLVVDQFEEIFTLCADDAERARFIGALVAAARAERTRTRVVLGIRADFYSHCTEHPHLLEALRDAQVPVGPLTSDELRKAIVGPAAHTGHSVEGALQERLLAEASERSGILPLVSHALLETWHRRRGNALTLAGYEAAGGLHGGLAQTAEAVYRALGEDQQRLAARIFRRLVAPGDGTEDTKRRVVRAEFGATDADTNEVLDMFARARLVTLDQGTVEITHEALIGSWPRLRSWISDDRDLLRAHRQLTEAAGEWEEHSRDDGLLYRGARLAPWRDRDLEQLNDHERRFLAASLDHEAREQNARRRRVRTVLVALALVLVLVSSLAVAAVLQANRAAEERDLALSRQLVAQSTAQLPLDPEVSLMLAKRAHGVRPSSEAASALRQAVVQSRAVASLRGHAEGVQSAALSPDGQRIASAGDEGTVRIWRANGGTELTLRGHDGPVWDVAFSPDGRHVASGGADGTVRIWGVDGGRPTVLRGHDGTVHGVEFSPDGRRLASTGDDGTVRVWPLPGVRGRIEVHRDRRQDDPRAFDVSFAPDGKRLVTGGADATVRVWRLASSARPTVLRGHEQSVEGVIFSPDGRRIASASKDGTVRLWSTTGRGEPAVLRGHEGGLEHVAFAPDGAHVATAGQDGTVRLWDAGADGDSHVLAGHSGPVTRVMFARDGRRLVSSSMDRSVRLWRAFESGDKAVLRGHSGPVWSVALSPDGQRVASGGDDGTVRVHRLDGQGDTVVLRGHRDAVESVAFSPDGRQVASGADDGTVRVWPADGEGEPQVLRGGHTQVYGVVFSPDGRRVIGGGQNGPAERGSIRVWTITGKSKPTTLPGSYGLVSGVAVSPDGHHIAGTGADGHVRVWPADGTRKPRTLRGHGAYAWRVAFSPDGRWLASSSSDGTVRVWPMSGSAEPTVLRGHQGIVWGLAFSPDGQRLVSAGNDRTVRVWTWRTERTPVVYNGFTASVENVAFNPRGDHLAAARGDGTVHIWRCEICAPMDTVLALAQRRITRALTTAERRDLLPQP